MLKVGDYAIAKIEKSARLFVYTDSHKLRLCDQKAMMNDELDSHHEQADLKILANVGSNPEDGTVFGVRTEPFIRQVKVPGWGQVHFFRRMKKIERARLIKALHWTFEAFNKKHIWPVKHFFTIVRPDISAKYAGMYRHVRNDDKSDTIMLFATSFMADTRYLVAHELAHSVWYTLMDKEDRNAWVQLYIRNNTPVRNSHNKITAIIKGIGDSESISAYRKQAEPDEKEVLKEALKYIKRVHHIREFELEDLIQSGENVDALWPSDPIWLRSHKPWVTDYSGESAAELFAEALSYYIVGKKIPEKIATQIEKTLKTLKAKGGGKSKKDKSEEE